jgi:glutamate decarboxylase
MLLELFHCPSHPADISDEDLAYMGCCTVGSSEALMLALNAMKINWRNRRREEGKDASKPNLVSE